MRAGRILVTGASGDVGSMTCRLLAEAGARFRAGVRRPEASPFEGVELVLLDYEKPETFGPAFSGAAKLFVIPPPSDAGDPFEILRPVIEAGLDSLEHVVLLTGDGVQHFEGIPLWHLEQWVMRCGVPWTILRPNWFMENFRRRQGVGLREEGRLVAPAGQGRCAFIAVEDVAACAVATLTATGHIGAEYVLTGPESLTHAEVARTLGTALGREIRFDDVAPEVFERYLVDREGASPARARTFCASYAAVPAGYAASVTADLPGLLGRPGIDFTSFARRDARNWR